MWDEGGSRGNVAFETGVLYFYSAARPFAEDLDLRYLLEFFAHLDPSVLSRSSWDDSGGVLNIPGWCLSQARFLNRVPMTRAAILPTPRPSGIWPK